MLSEESRNKYMTLLIGIVIGMMIGFVVGLFMSGHIPSDPRFGLPRLDVFSTTMLCCIITIVIALLYLYIAEWSQRGKTRETEMKKAEA